MTIPFVVPATDMPSGGTLYDLRITHAGSGLLRTVPVAGAWPRPGPQGRAALSRVLERAPDGGRVLLDGLVACGVPEVILPQARRLRLVVLVHLPLSQETGLDPERAQNLDIRERAVLRSCATVVATGEWAARWIREHHGLDRVAVVPPGVDPAPPARGSGFEDTAGAVPRLLCVASLTPRKGHDVLFEALSDLDDLVWECVCVGPGTPLPGAGERVRFTGPLRGPELEAAYDSADLLVLPSRAETYGMVVTEALARGVPVVAGEVGGVPEALGRASDASVPGLLVPPGRPRALADALRSWLTEPRVRERLRASARSRRGDLAGWDEAARAMDRVLDLV
ncbi:glycosyltransferase family 4 protein [Nocardiopsis alkaliphila]|uniref:glycosyltransferase family 4 protein n=1 Tax=Nocardiopsis alkaliphila TaxID=225762 RepID=UPI00034BEF95|nr:glycosyltransferase family 4 protein [Nocardiopsis alkaliphila]